MDIISQGVHTHIRLALYCVYYGLVQTNLHISFRITSMALYYSYVTMGVMASQITSLTIVYSTVYSGADKKSKLRVTGLCGGIHRWPVNSPRKGPVTLKMFPFDDAIMVNRKIVIIPMKYICWVHRSHGSTKSYVIAKIKKHNVTVSQVHPVPGLLFRYAFLFWRKLTAF